MITKDTLDDTLTSIADQAEAYYKYADTIAEPEFSGNQYWVSRDTLTCYGLPEYDTVDQDTDYSRYPRLSKAIEASSADVGIYDNQLVVWLSGNIVYKPTATHRRAARLIMKLYGDS